MSRISIISAIVVLMFVSTSPRAEADILTYTESVTGTGTLGGAAFTNSLVTLTTTANTNNITLSNGIYVATAAGSVTIAGFSPAVFTSNLEVFCSTNTGFLTAGIEGFSGTQYLDIIDTGNSVFSTYNLMTPFGPITGGFTGNPGVPYGTSSGAFVLLSVSSNSVFTASSPGVPEPSGFVLASIGTACLVGWNARHSWPITRPAA
jgi:hypothetical protein